MTVMLETFEFLVSKLENQRRDVRKSSTPSKVSEMTGCHFEENSQPSET